MKKIEKLKTLGATEKKLKNGRNISKMEKRNKKQTFKRHRRIEKDQKHNNGEKEHRQVKTHRTMEKKN